MYESVIFIIAVFTRVEAVAIAVAVRVAVSVSDVIIIFSGLATVTTGLVVIDEKEVTAIKSVVVSEDEATLQVAILTWACTGDAWLLELSMIALIQSSSASSVMLRLSRLYTDSWEKS